MKGEVLYHSLISKTEEEKIGLRKRAAMKEETKKMNKQIQEENVKRKEDAIAEKKLKKVKRSKAWEARKQGKDVEEIEEEEEKKDNEDEEDYDFLV